MMKTFLAGVLLCIPLTGCASDGPVVVSGNALTPNKPAEYVPESSISVEKSAEDERWQVVPGVKVSLLTADPARTLIASAVTGPDGRYELRADKQDAILRAEKEGYKPVELKITVSPFGHYMHNTIFLMPQEMAP